MAPENTGPPQDFAGHLPLHSQPQGQSQSPLFPMTAPSYGQPNFVFSPSMADWQGIGQPSLDCAAPSEFVSPTNIINNSDIDPLDYNLTWSGPDTGSALSNAAPESLMTRDPNPWCDDDFDNDISLTVPKSEAEGYLSQQIYGGTRKRQKKVPTGVTSEVAMASSSATTFSHNSRASIGSTASTLTSTASGSTASSRQSKLRSASRTSKSTHHKPAETAEERRTRASHNMVEKQYRNRLNSQFEALLNALPEQVRSGGEGEDSEPVADFTDKRVSKAEVLDMARRYIKTLERERDTLERERNDLYKNVEKLRENCGLPKGDGDGMFGADEDDDMDEGASGPIL